MEREDYPPLSQIAGHVSQDGQRWYMRLIVIELGVALLAAVLVDIGSAFPGDIRVTFAAVAIGFLLVALAIQVIRLLRLVRFDEKWFEGRAVAESIKTTPPRSRIACARPAILVGKIAADSMSRRDWTIRSHIVPKPASTAPGPAS